MTVDRKRLLTLFTFQSNISYGYGCIRNTFPWPSTRFALLRHTFPTCRWCVFKASRAKPCTYARARVCVCVIERVCFCVCVCERLRSHLGDKKLTQANFCTFIFILLVTRPSANHPAPHRGKRGEREEGSLQSLQQAGYLSFHPLHPPSLQHSEGQR